mgnify:CR=1 FL=1
MNDNVTIKQRGEYPNNRYEVTCSQCRFVLITTNNAAVARLYATTHECNRRGDRVRVRQYIAQEASRG